MIIEKIDKNIKLLDGEKRRIHTIELTHDDIEKRHQRLSADSGFEIAVSLAEGEALFDGAVLYENDEEIVVVKAAKEKVIIMEPRTNKEWGMLAYNIGNMHQKAFLTEKEILVPYDHVLEGVIRKFDVPMRIEECPILGTRANVTAKEHAIYHEHRSLG